MRAIPMTPQARGDDPILDISSLIDVSFLLLVFFLVTSTLTEKEADLSLSIPGCCDGGQFAYEPMRIGIDRYGTISVDGEPVAIDSSNREAPELRQQIQERQNLAQFTNSDLSIRIEAADDARHQRLIDVMNALAARKVTTFAFAF